MKVDSIIPRHHRLGFLSCVGAAALAGLAPHPASAEINLLVSSIVQYDYDSNIFDLPNGVYPATTSGTGKRGDSYQVYGAGLELNELWGLQKFHATVVGKDIRYDSLSDLTHSEYTLNGGLDWKLATTVGGNLDVTRSRVMVNFYDLTQTTLALQEEQREAAEIRWNFIPDWRIRGNGYYRVINEPLDGEPDLQLRESSETASLEYQGVSGLITGLSGNFIHGGFSGSNGFQNPSYKQGKADFEANYQVTGRSSFLGEAGYARRTSPIAAYDESAFTGQLVYSNQLTPKTGIRVSVVRQISSYFVDSGSLIETLATVGVNWQPTYKTSVTASYTYNNRVIPDQGVVAGTDRVDHQQQVLLKVAYQPFYWLSIQPIVNLQVRRSNDFIGDYNSSVFSLTFNLHWQCSPPSFLDLGGSAGACPI